MQKPPPQKARIFAHCSLKARSCTGWRKSTAPEAVREATHGVKPFDESSRRRHSRRSIERRNRGLEPRFAERLLPAACAAYAASRRMHCHPSLFLSGSPRQQGGDFSGRLAGPRRAPAPAPREEGRRRRRRSGPPAAPTRSRRRRPWTSPKTGRRSRWS
jgi:hypothetical protein